MVFGSYLFQLIVRLKPGFNCSSSFALYWVDKVTTGRKNLVSVTANVSAFVSLDNTHLSDPVKIRLFSRLIKDISRVLLKILKYVSGTTISTSFVPPSAVLPVIFAYI